MKIAETDILGQAFIDEFFHCLPSLVQRSVFCKMGLENGWRHCLSMLTEMDLAVIAKPLSWVTMARVHICKRDGKVNKEKIEVVKTPVFELFLRQCLGLKPHLVGVTLDHEKRPT